MPRYITGLSLTTRFDIMWIRFKQWTKGKKWRERQAEINRRNNEWQDTPGCWTLEDHKKKGIYIKKRS